MRERIKAWLDSKWGKFVAWILEEAGVILITALVDSARVIFGALIALCILMLGMRFALDYPTEAAVAFTPDGSSIPYLEAVLIHPILQAWGIMLGGYLVLKCMDLFMGFVVSDGLEDLSLSNKSIAVLRSLADALWDKIRERRRPAKPLTVHNHPE